MKQNLYVFHDVVSGRYGEPFTASNDEEVRRSFASSCGMCNNPFSKHTLTDTEAVHIGFIDTDVIPMVSGCSVRRILNGLEPEFQSILQLAMDAFYEGDDVDEKS